MILTARSEQDHLLLEQDRLLLAQDHLLPKHDRKIMDAVWLYSSLLHTIYYQFTTGGDGTSSK